MLYSGFNILPRSVFWSADFNGRSDNTDVIPLNDRISNIMRWKLKTTLGIVAIICVLLARFGYIHNQYHDLRTAGVQLYFDWQNPVVGQKTVMFNRQEENKWIPVTAIIREYDLAPRQRTLLNRLSNCFVSNEPVSLQVSAVTLTPDLIQTIKSMPKLTEILLLHAVDPNTLRVDPKGDEIIRMLQLESQGAQIHLVIENASVDAAGG